jgi:hypothetical protein
MYFIKYSFTTAGLWYNYGKIIPRYSHSLINWTDIVDIATDFHYKVGVKSGGTVVAASDDDTDREETKWSGMGFAGLADEV